MTEVTFKKLELSLIRAQMKFGICGQVSDPHVNLINLRVIHVL